MCTVSFVKEALKITIHNQYQNLELTAPVYFSTGTTCHVSPGQQTNAGATMEASFGIVLSRKILNVYCYIGYRENIPTKLTINPMIILNLSRVLQDIYIFW
jgi:hypothetical protein